MNFKQLLSVLTSLLISGGLMGIPAVFGADNQALTVSGTLQAQAPVITSVSTDLASYDPVESSVVTVTTTFYVYDADGIENLDNATILLDLEDGEGNVIVNDDTCDTLTAQNSTFTVCVVTSNIEYYRPTGTWGANATASDIDAGTGTGSYQFTLTELKAITLNATAVAFGNFYLTDSASMKDTVEMNNTGNAVISSGSVEVEGYDLLGETNPAYTLPVANFRASPSDWASGIALVNATSTAITGLTLDRLGDGNNGLEDVGFGINPQGFAGGTLAQTYSNDGTSERWVIKIV